jgi:cobalamin biosynthesis protein CbiG
MQVKSRNLAPFLTSPEQDPLVLVLLEDLSANVQLRRKRAGANRVTNGSKAMPLCHLT